MTSISHGLHAASVNSTLRFTAGGKISPRGENGEKMLKNKGFLEVSDVFEIERAIASVREDRRADYLFSTKTAADAVKCHPNKFGDWWRRTREKLVDLSISQPAETAAEMTAILAQAAAERERKGKP